MVSKPRRANQYQFSLSNPLQYVDPDGLDPITGGFDGFAGHCSEGHICGAPTETPVVDAAETSTSALREMIGQGIAKKRDETKNTRTRIVDVPIPEFAPEDSDVRFAPPGWEEGLRCSTPDQCQVAEAIGVAWLVLLIPAAIGTVPAIARATGGGAATRPVGGVVEAGSQSAPVTLGQVGGTAARTPGWISRADLSKSWGGLGKKGRAPSTPCQVPTCTGGGMRPGNFPDPGTGTLSCALCLRRKWGDTWYELLGRSNN